jgi:hypothetical protein
MVDLRFEMTELRSEGYAAFGQTLGRQYFRVMAGLLLGVVLVGFAPTFHLKAFFDTPALPLHLHAHGVLLIAWFVLFLTQSVLVASGRMYMHRRLGLASIGLATALVPVTVATTIRAAVAWLGALSQDDAAAIERWIFAVTGNFVLIGLFLVFFTLAICLRRRPDWHKRLMLLASLSLVAPAVDRLGRVAFAIEPVSSPFIPVVMVTLLLSLIAHDVLVRRRPHWGSVSGVVTFLAAIQLGTRFSQSDTGRSLVLALAGMS